MILDTNALSAMADGDPGFALVLRELDDIALPVVVLGEYLYGIKQSRHRQRYERWLEELLRSCRVLQADRSTAEQYSALRTELKQKGRPIPANDLWIAALARQHCVGVLSRDAHFDGITGLNRTGW